MKKAHLFHFNKNEAAERAAAITALGFTVDTRQPDGPDFFKQFKANPPDVVIIDLSRTPSSGRDIGVFLRCAKATRFIPLLFVGGELEKIAKTKELLPDAVYTTWPAIAADLQRALDKPLLNPVVPESSMAGYSGAPLPKKLGIKAGMVVGLVNAPEDFRQTLGELPADVQLVNHATAECTLLLWFLRSFAQLQADISQMTQEAGHAKIWMIWPKKTSPLACDLGEVNVRATGLAAGLVDYKVCAVDSIWSGLLFTQRKIPAGQ